MFGKNAIVKYDEHGGGIELRVVKDSPFLTIQGEGPFAGHPAVFIRLNGCHLKCTFCDTKFDDPKDPVLPYYEVVRRVNSISRSAKLVVITGGEPMVQNIGPLVQALRAEGYLVQIETAGTFYRPCMVNEGVTVVVSPKTPVVDARVRDAAACFKYVVDSFMQFNSIGVPITNTQNTASGKVLRTAALAAPNPGTPVYYSPMDAYDPKANALNRKAAVDAALRYGGIVLPQIHKVLELVEPV
jgi:organic radical activating enzyme